MQGYLISYELNDGERQETGGDMLIKWYELGGVENKPKTCDPLMDFHYSKWYLGHGVVKEDSLETIWKK